MTIQVHEPLPGQLPQPQVERERPFLEILRQSSRSFHQRLLDHVRGIDPWGKAPSRWTAIIRRRHARWPPKSRLIASRSPCWARVRSTSRTPSRGDIRSAPYQENRNPGKKRKRQLREFQKWLACRRTRAIAGRLLGRDRPRSAPRFASGRSCGMASDEACDTAIEPRRSDVAVQPPLANRRGRKFGVLSSDVSPRKRVIHAYWQACRQLDTSVPIVEHRIIRGVGWCQLRLAHALTDGA